MKKRGIKIFSFFLAASLLLTACSAGSGSRIEPEQSALQNTAISQPQRDPKKTSEFGNLALLQRRSKNSIRPYGAGVQ